jgi:hypothetical protein
MIGTCFICGQEITEKESRYTIDFDYECHSKRTCYPNIQAIRKRLAADKKKKMEAIALLNRRTT